MDPENTRQYLQLVSRILTQLEENNREYRRFVNLVHETAITSLLQQPRRRGGRTPVPPVRMRQTPNPEWTQPGLENHLYSILSGLQNVVVAPSAEDIRREIYSIDYNELPNPANSRCPITLEDFESGQFVNVIRHCGHVFQREALANWFRTNVRCPVCRYDIRTGAPNVHLTPAVGLEQLGNLQDEMDVLNDRRTNILDNLFMDEDISGNTFTVRYEFGG